MTIHGEMGFAVKAWLKNNHPQLWNKARIVAKGLKLGPRLFGHKRRDCNICGYSGHFLAEIHFPDIFNFDALCPNCGSLPRNRLIRLAQTQAGVIKSDDRLLHFAPEGSVRRQFQTFVKEYATTDLNPVGVDYQENIEGLSFPDGRWDAIICSHVLEHVDHKKALAELYRVLAPGGRLLALFPIVEGWTQHYENDAVVSEADRAIHFGKENHLRRFGRNVRAEFSAAGFQLDDFVASGPDAVRYGLLPGEVLFVGRKA